MKLNKTNIQRGNDDQIVELYQFFQQKTNRSILKSLESQNYDHQNAANLLRNSDRQFSSHTKPKQALKIKKEFIHLLQRTMEGKQSILMFKKLFNDIFQRFNQLCTCYQCKIQVAKIQKILCHFHIISHRDKKQYKIQDKFFEQVDDPQCLICMKQFKEKTLIPKIFHFDQCQYVIFLTDEEGLIAQKVLQYCCALSNSYSGGLIFIGVKKEEFPKCNSIPERAQSTGMFERVDEGRSFKYFFINKVAEMLKKFKSLIHIDTVKVKCENSSEEKFMVRIYVKPSKKLQFYTIKSSYRERHKISVIHSNELRILEFQQIYSEFLKSFKAKQRRRRHSDSQLQYRRYCKYGEEQSEQSQKINSSFSNQSSNELTLFYRNQTLVTFSNKMTSINQILKILKQKGANIYNYETPFKNEFTKLDVDHYVLSHQDQSNFLIQSLQKRQYIKVLQITKSFTFNSPKDDILKPFQQKMWDRLSYRLEEGQNYIKKKKGKQYEMRFRFQNLEQSLYGYLFLFSNYYRPTFDMEPRLYGHKSGK